MQLPLKRLEQTLLLALGAGIFLSKPLIYISSTCFLILAIFRILFDAQYSKSIFTNKIFQLGIALYFLGIIGVGIASLNLADTAWIARKSTYLLLIGPLYLAFSDRSNRLCALTGVFLGFWIASILTGHQHNWLWAGNRLSGATWLVDAWAVICALLVGFLVPLLFSRENSKIFRCIVAVTLLVALLMLLTSGARAAWLGVAASILAYLAIYQRKAFLFFIVSAVILYLPTKEIWPTQVRALEDRVKTISNWQSDESSYTRVALWDAGYAFLSQAITSGNLSVWFGQGRDTSSDVATRFYQTWSAEGNGYKSGFLGDRKINDLHNMYLDSFMKNGIFWTTGNIILFLLLACTSAWRNEAESSHKKILDSSRYTFPITTIYLMIGIFYSILPHFSTLFIVFFLALSTGIQQSHASK